MNATNATPVLDKLFDPVTDCLTTDALKQLVNLHADADLQARLDTLADKNTEGLLGAE